MGAARHLDLLPDLQCETLYWPVPFAEGIAQLLELRGQRVVVLASGDPFWFGAGAVIARHLEPHEWHALPGVSCFALAAARLGWALERTTCLGLHAAPLQRVRPHLAPGARILVLLRDGAAVTELGQTICDLGFGTSRIHVMEALGGPRERIQECAAQTLVSDTTTDRFSHPVCVGIEPLGAPGLSRVPGREDALFANDGQITKSPVRALTLAALAPRPFETLWDIGGGSGSISIEWLLADPSTQAIAIEADPQRAERIDANARTMGVDRLNVVRGRAPEALANLPLPDAVFVGGGLSDAMLQTLWTRLPAGTRLVANAVTLETETLVSQWQTQKGGALLRIELARATPLGTRRGWKAAYPVVQWSVTL